MYVCTYKRGKCKYIGEHCCNQIRRQPLSIKKPKRKKKDELKTKKAPKHQCNICNQQFPRAKELKTHQMELHKSERPYFCSVCEKRYHTQSSLQQHQCEHEKPQFQCSLCAKWFHKKDKLSRHMSTQEALTFFQWFFFFAVYHSKKNFFGVKIELSSINKAAFFQLFSLVLIKNVD
ncbi:hypothetical protein RFI_08956 [Reticulomyxa filosa]|uniref:C2H2-type domain-containing protein n=1 Tax=Reticulomyxa filosa TaxID=46433 RepID=X6NQI3_RETFI|nr:hypothetical protein RFI_08956 [Reticulomyxa filosa]|eukprot:ETO28178.1 hypothetical protein RFI_08956 [Reticulomyxa filosa]